MQFPFNFCIGILALIFLAGCSSQKPEFPIGIYGVPRTNDFAEIKAAGFNVIVGNAEKTCLDAARQNGLKVLASPEMQAGRSFDPKRAAAVVRRFDSHPALWAWYLVDEPDLNLVSPSAVSEANRVVKRAGAKKPTALVLYKGSEALHFASIADITMIDRYPIPWRPLASFPQHVQMTRLALGNRKPLIAVVQAFNWETDRKNLPGEENLRAPTYEEMRCMSYAALAEGATGLFYFAYDTGAWQMKNQPETWRDLRLLVSELIARKPLLEAEHVWWPYVHEFERKENFKGWNEAGLSAINLALLKVSNGNENVAAGFYILAVNNTPETFGYKVTMPFSMKKNLRLIVMGEDREVGVENGWLRDEFAPYAVHVYGPF